MTTIDFYLNDKWSQTLKNIVASGQIQESVLPYFESKLVSLDNNTALVTVPTFINYTLMSDHKELIKECLSEVFGREMDLKIVEQEDYERQNIPKALPVINDFITRDIDSNQTFANFVVGRSNAQAQLASLTCASNLAIVYNPLFIYGNSGLGKTHLLNAIGNQVKTLYPEKRVGFVSGLEFVEGVYRASQENRFEDFKKAFQDLDVLLVDDVQFIAGKPKTHELFFSVFNELVNNRKQICLTSDRTPTEMRGLEERIISRFNQGLTVNIEAPEYETSINILKMKIANSSGPSQLTVDDEVLNYLATNFSQDVRSLEGAVNRLLFYSINFPIDEDRDEPGADGGRRKAFGRRQGPHTFLRYAGRYVTTTTSQNSRSHPPTVPKTSPMPVRSQCICAGNCWMRHTTISAENSEAETIPRS